MALSQNVKDSLDEAQGALRSALYHASRSEKPIIAKKIADVLLSVENVIKIEQMSDSMEEMIKKTGFKGDFFGF